MKKLYFDHNVIIDIQNSRKKSLQDVVNTLNENKYQIVFSPAHIEEIAAIIMHHNQQPEIVNDKLNFLAALTNSVALLPYHRNNLELIEHDGIFVYREHPKDVYDRVIDNYDRNIIVEKHQQEKLSNGENFENVHSVSSKETNNINIVSELDYFKPRLHQMIIDFWRTYDSNLKEYMPEICPKCADLNFQYAKNYFPIHQMMIEKLLEFLEVRRFFPDSPNQYLSSLHDTTHAIYAGYCDIFVTNDNKLKQKVSAVYQWMGIKTSVLNANEFRDYVANETTKNTPH